MEDKTAGEEAPIHIPHHISLQKIAVFLILALVLTAGIAFAVKNLINKEVSPSEIISGSKIPTLVPNAIMTPEPTMPVSIETANWKTYTSNFGYVFKYPSDWIIGSNCKFGQLCFNSPDFVLADTGIQEGGGGIYYAEKGGSVSISQLPNEGQKTFSQIQAQDFCTPGGPLCVSSCADTLIDGLRAKEQVQCGYGKVKDINIATVYFVLTKNNIVYLDLRYSSNESIKKTLDQILSTFKFTN